MIFFVHVLYGKSLLSKFSVFLTLNAEAKGPKYLAFLSEAFLEIYIFGNGSLKSTFIYG